MAESVDALVSNTSRFTPVPVRPRLWVQKTLVEQLLRGFLLFKTSKMVTFGHHFENGGPKMGSNKGIKKCRKFRFLRAEQQIIIFIFCYTEKNSTNLKAFPNHNPLNKKDYRLVVLCCEFSFVKEKRGNNYFSSPLMLLV